MRAFDQSLDLRPLGRIVNTDQVVDGLAKQVWSGDVFPLRLPSQAPRGTKYFRSSSSSMRLPKITYDLFVSEEAVDSVSQSDFNFHVAFVLDSSASSVMEDHENVAPEFYHIWARADSDGYYIYDDQVRPRQNVRNYDRFTILREHIIEVPPQWNFNSNLPENNAGIAEWDYNSVLWQGILPWDSSIYQPRPGFPGPWTGEGPDPRTPYIQGDGADMTREFRWGQETIQFGQPGLPCDSVLQTETQPPSGSVANPDEKQWSGFSFGDNPGLYGVQFDAYPPTALVHGLTAQRPITQWNNQIGGYATIGRLGSKSETTAQQTHRVVKAREGARCVRTNHATFLNDVDVMIDGVKTNFYAGSFNLDDELFREYVTIVTPGGGFAPEAVVSYDKRLYVTAWTQSEGLESLSFVPIIRLRIRIEFEEEY